MKTSGRTFFTAAMSVAALLSFTTAAHTQTAKLEQTPFSDGTGSIGVPPGWKIGGVYNGAVQCVGPNGAAVAMKVPWTIMRPESSVSQLPAAASQPMAPAGDIKAAIREVLKKKAGATLKSVRGKRLQDVSPGSPAYMILYEFVQNGKTMTGLGYFASLDYGGDQPFWQLYSSAMVAPKAQFAKVAPTMIRIWRSWRPNGQPPQEGSASAIFDKVMREHRASYDWIQEQFRENL